MHNYHAQQIVFSPTGTTRKIIEAITVGLVPESWSQMDLTYPTSDQASAATRAKGEEFVLIGTPVYAGRVPNLTLERLRSSVQGKGRRAVLVVVYGNRAYDDALLELYNVAVDLGFVPIAAAAFVGEHSFSSPDWPVGQGRPDKLDLEMATKFGESVHKKLLAMTSLADNATRLCVPGNFPYRDGVQPAPISPETEPDKCILCGECIRSCPNSAISVVNEMIKTDKMQCLRCCACTRICPTGARVMIHPKVLELGRTLHEKCGARREPEWYL